MSEKTEQTSPVVQAAAKYVTELLAEKLPTNFVYHDAQHTKEVVEAAREIGLGSQLSPEELEIVELAAWFHDTGFTKTVEGHEDVSSTIAAEFLQHNDYPAEKIAKVQACILKTRYPSEPETLLQQVMCDADMHHIGTKEYMDRNDLLRNEWERVSGDFVEDYDWVQKNIDFLTQHTFYTRYAKNEYAKRKSANLAKLQKTQRKLKQKKDEADAKLAVQKAKLESIEKKSTTPERGIETMFRVTLRNHINLSAIADNKANMLISVNAIIISILVTLLVRKLDTNVHLIAPTMILLSVCVATIIFATISTRPKVSEGTFTQEDIRQRKVNLLFFGNFHNVALDDFIWGMNEMMHDRQYLYETMMKDFYFLGKVLVRKYRFLRISYDVFMYGLIVSILAFAIAVILEPGPTNLEDILQEIDQP